MADGAEIVELQNQVREVYVDPVLSNYMVQLVQATRRHDDVELGASPRATLGDCSGVLRPLAAIRGRAFVTPDDVKLLAPYTLSHRIILKSQARLRERRSENVVADLLSQVGVPV